MTGQPTGQQEMPNDLPGIILMIVGGLSSVVVGAALLKKYFDARRQPKKQEARQAEGEWTHPPAANGTAVSPGY